MTILKSAWLIIPLSILIELFYIKALTPSAKNVLASK